ncbi:MAG TPA: adenine phosphoribosyltransferase [Candidatus Limnocylindria bacterium]|nr:adenine phosphoribosyltransferase [Candidatus Limnocylindria bacterium]
MLDLRSYIRDVPDFPRPGIVFKDIMPLLAAPRALAEAVRRMAARVEPPEAVVAIESRGFVFGTALALHWAAPLVPARKFGKLPGRIVRQSYALEYGEDTLEMHADALRSGQGVVIVDDLLATGGTAAAAARLVEQLGARVDALLFLIELQGLGGRAQLAPYAVEALLEYEVSEEQA